MKEMVSFIDMSHYAGMREDLVQAGGGNSAYKMSDSRMIIKASGYQLADITMDYGFSVVDYKIIRDAFQDEKLLNGLTEEDANRILKDATIEGSKPSIETFLHSITGKYSLHTHPILVNAITCRKNGESIIKSLFPKSLIVPYATPGIELAKLYFKKFNEYKEKNNKEPETVFLMNHGFVASSDKAEEVIELTEKTSVILEKYLHVDYSHYRLINEINRLYSKGITWLVTDCNVSNTLKKKKKLWKHNFCPDCVVFMGKQIYDAIDLDKKHFEHFVDNNGIPVVLRYKDHLYIHADSVCKAKEIQSILSFSAQVAMLNEDNVIETLKESEMNYLLNWDAEKYRKALK